MYRAHRTDVNQAPLVDCLRRAGRTVAITSALGNGFPDIVVGWRGQCCPHDCDGPDHLRGKLALPMEIKDGELAPSRQRLTEEEAAFHATWRGPIVIVRTMAEALRFTGVGI